MLVDPVPLDGPGFIRDHEERISHLERRIAGSGASITVSHAFVIQAALEDPMVNGTFLQPWRAVVPDGEEQWLVYIGQEGPAVGTCDVYWRVNVTDIDSGVLPLQLFDGDLLTALLDPGSGAERISLPFAILHIGAS